MRPAPPGERITDLLNSWLAGDREAGERLFESLYAELKPVARRQLRRGERHGTLDTAAVVHEAYLKLAATARQRVRDRAHFMALVARVMRQIVLDHARRRNAA